MVSPKHRLTIEWNLLLPNLENTMVSKKYRRQNCWVYMIMLEPFPKIMPSNSDSTFLTVCIVSKLFKALSIMSSKLRFSWFWIPSSVYSPKNVIRSDLVKQIFNSSRDNMVSSIKSFNWLNAQFIEPPMSFKARLRSFGWAFIRDKQCGI